MFFHVMLEYLDQELYPRAASLARRADAKRGRITSGKHALVANHRYRAFRRQAALKAAPLPGSIFHAPEVRDAEGQAD
jgi:hypothetical protein